MGIYQTTQDQQVNAEAMIEAVRMALKNLRAKGDPFKIKAESHLGIIESFLSKLDRDRIETDEALVLAKDAVEALDAKADELLSVKADELWELLGRPPFDVLFTSLLPFGIGDHGDQAIVEQPERMHLLAGLFESGGHWRINDDVARTMAAEIRVMANEYRIAVEHLVRLQKTRALVDVLVGKVASAGLVEMGKLRRALRTLGVEESEIRILVPGAQHSRPITS